MSENKMLTAYRHLLNSAKEFALKTEMATWDTLGHAIDNAEEKASELEVLTQQELNQVREDLKADLQQTAEYLNDFEQGVESFLEMEWENMEAFLIQKSEDVADPTTLMVLRMRLMAAMNPETD